MNLLESLDFTKDGMLASTLLLRATNVTCVVGALLAFLSMRSHLKQHRLAKEGVKVGRTKANLVTLSVLALSNVLIAASVGYRWVEVNHFPSQTMSEVLTMFSAALLLSMVVLHFALKLKKIGPAWATVDDALLVMVFLGAWATNYYSSSLSTAQRDLPPALQSYWFPPHLVALIFSYATMGIAGLVCLVYFSTRFWSGVFSGGQTRLSQILVLLFLAILPFAQLITLPVLALVGVVFFGLKLTGNLPEKEALTGLEATMDKVSYRAFAVGIPFLTAGLFMGAFWAQEAWANYWGWDSKENSALITWLVYVVYIHLRMLGGYRGEKAMAVLMGGALSVFMTFQVFGYLPDSQKSLHRYTDDGVVPREGNQGVVSDNSAKLEKEPK